MVSMYFDRTAKTFTLAVSCVAVAVRASTERAFTAYKLSYFNLGRELRIRRAASSNETAHELSYSYSEENVGGRRKMAKFLMRKRRQTFRSSEEASVTGFTENHLDCRSQAKVRRSEIMRPAHIKEKHAQL